MSAGAGIWVSGQRHSITAYGEDKETAEADLAAIQASIATCFNSADYREGRTAFMAKRKPVFTGV